MESLLQLCFCHIIKIKMFHFQTKSYAKHKSSDEYFGKFLDNFDKFFEVYQGINGKFNINKININISIPTDETIGKEIDNTVNCFNEISSFVQNTDLLNIRDEIIADLNQLKYLLTFN